MEILTLFPSWVPSTILLLLFTYIFMYIIRRSPSIKHPPSPRRLPIIGNLHQVFGKDTHIILANLSKKYGQIMLLRFGSKPFVVISSSEMAAQVLKTHDHEMCTRPYTRGGEKITFNYMDVGFAPYNDHWKYMRKVFVTEFLGAKRSKLFKKELEFGMESLISSLSLNPLRTEVDIGRMLTLLMHDTVSKVAFGKTYRDERFNGRSLTDIANETIGLMIDGALSDFFPTFGWFFDELRGWNRKLEKCYSDLDSALQKILDEHKETKTDDHENDFIDDNISRLTNAEMKAILLNILNGAIDTTSSTLVSALSELARNPRIMQKLQKEIRSCVGGKPRVDESDTAKMPYLKLVVKETLRLHPPAQMLIPHESMSHCEIGGYDILPGTKILVNVWAIGRDPTVWKENPNTFHPERFEDIKVDFGGKNFEMIPFGAGRRACPGYNSALSTIETLLTNFLYLFDWETPSGLKNADWEIDGKTLRLVPVKHNSQD